MCDVAYKIQRTDHLKLTQGLLRLCMMLPSYYYELGTKEECRRILSLIDQEAKETTFLRRNNWEPLLSFYKIETSDDELRISSLQGKLYITFKIVEV